MKYIFFDLDGTLLPMVQDDFVRCYYTLLTEKMSKYGVEPSQLINALNYGVYLMTVNDGSKTNEDAFWTGYEKILGIKKEKYINELNDFYETDFNKAIVSTKPDPIVRDIIDLCHEKGYKIVLATSPLFPRSAIYNRIRWAGLKPEDFVHITTYEDCHYCKPDLGYYREIMDKLEIKQEGYYMIGNDIGEDLVSKQLGFVTYLITDYIENRANMSYEPDYKGSLKDLYEFIKQL